MIAFADMLPPIAEIPAGTEPSSAPRFTLDGDAPLERHLAQTCARVLSGIRGLVPADKLEAVLLGGGYGRGEGGVLRTAAGDRPYNDLEFYVAIAGNRHVNELRYAHRLHVLGEILTRQAGVEVEFKITSRAEIATRPVSMFSYDLVMGHRLIWDATHDWDLSDCEHHRHPENIPLNEASRLLMNRFSGLLFAREQLNRAPFTDVAADFVRRNLAKAQLAMGDAVLSLHGCYHWSCRERHRRLQRIARDDASSWFALLLHHHAAGTDFKLHPAAATLSRPELLALHAEVTAFALGCWLWIESRRLGRTFGSAQDYAFDPGDQQPETARWLNVILNFRADGFRAGLRPKPWRHPRQRLCRALALLLWEPAALRDETPRRKICQELNVVVADFQAAVGAYERLWVRVR